MNQTIEITEDTDRSSTNNTPINHLQKIKSSEDDEFEDKKENYG